ncbi:MAG: CRISPR-associated helicase Cas3' [Lachnospiraceae bacterium]|nr:CRISPR-associated helicase Cas3' [Lachnospiraceae bacterium]
MRKIDYIAHISEDGKRKQTIKEHSENVAKLCERFSIQRLKPIAYNIGMLHDIGKYQKSFQKRIKGENIKIEHSICGAKESLNLYNKNLISLLMEYAIAGHHTGLVDYGNEKTDIDTDTTLCGRMLRKIEDYSNYKNELLLHRLNVDEYLNSLFEYFELKDEKSLYDKISIIERYLYSCLVDADNIDTADFCNNSKHNTLNSNYDICLKKIEKQLESFISITKLQKTRKLIQDRAFNKVNENANIYVLNMPTGSGKTLCSMKFALERAIKGNKKHIIYVIPYNSIIDQTADSFSKIFGDSATILRHQSTYTYDDDGYDEDYIEIIKKAEENWDASIIITTMVQFFESIYSNKKSKLRKFHNMADSIIVFDEVHLINIELLQPCLSAMTILCKYFNSEILLLSATMPNYIKLIKKYVGIDINIIDLIEDKKEFYLFDTNKYEYIKEKSIEELYMEIKDYPSSLVVFNKRKHVEEIYKLAVGKKYYLTTYLIPKDRKKIIESIKKELRQLEIEFNQLKNIPEERKIRVFSTSLIEAGVDLDFFIVYRELNGLDNIIQSAGRCNREGKFDNAIVKIFKLNDTMGKFVDNIKLSITQGILEESNEITLEQIEKYYDRLYFMDRYKEQIMSKSMREFCKNNKMNPVPFRSYSDSFKMINNSQISIVVPVDDMSMNLINEIRDGNNNIDIYRNLYNYSISLYINEFEELIKQKVIEDIGNGMYYLKNLAYYDNEIGLRFQGIDYFI